MTEIDKLTVCIKLLKRKYEDCTNHVSGGQFRFVTRVNVNVDGIAGVDNAVEKNSAHIP